MSRYEVGETLGRGGMGEVREATDVLIGRRVAIKTIRSREPSERAVKRFFREARIQGRLEHPAIPAVHELGHDADGRPFFVMKKLAGTTLAKLMHVKARPTRQRLLRALVDVCLAVELAHVHGIIHRDLKPDNIMLGDFGEVYVLDWGVAKVVGEDDSFDDISEDELATRQGAVLGTPGYMAPEQARGQGDIDARADVYSLGIVLRDILDYQPDGDAPPELRVLVEQATAARREDRTASARILADTIQRYLDGDRDLALRRRLAAEHVTNARAALAAGTNDARAVAMREAGRAIALDPEVAEAGELIGRLMLDPPTQTPPDVEQELRRDASERAHASARGVLWGFLAFLGFLPNLVKAGGYGIALFVAFAVAFAAVLLVARRYIQSPWWLALAIAPAIVIIARLFSPTLIASGMAAVIAGVLATSPLLGGTRASIALWLLMSSTVVGPLVLERLGWIAPTMEAVPGVGILLRGPVISESVATASIRGGLFVVVLIGAAVLVSHVVRRSDEELRRRLHLQAWHLRQLFPR